MDYTSSVKLPTELEDAMHVKWNTSNCSMHCITTFMFTQIYKIYETNLRTSLY